MMVRGCVAFATASLVAVLALQQVVGGKGQEAVSDDSDSTYEIDLDVNGIIETFSSGFFTSAAEKWASAITGDVPDVQGIEGDSQICGPYPTEIDDLWICGRFQPIDFFGGVLGMAGPTIVRTDSNIPAAGIMLFDKFDLPGMWIDGTVQGIIVSTFGCFGKGSRGSIIHFSENPPFFSLSHSLTLTHTHTHVHQLHEMGHIVSIETNFAWRRVLLFLTNNDNLSVFLTFTTAWYWIQLGDDWSTATRRRWQLSVRC